MQIRVRSWELWHSLFHHPLLNAPLIQKHFAARSTSFRSYNPLHQLRRISLLNSEFIQMTLAFCAFIAVCVLCISNLSLVMNLLARLFDTLLFGILVVLLMTASILPGINLALKVSGAIFNEQAKGRYDLLALAPRGLAALHWALLMRCVRDDVIARQLRRMIEQFGVLFLLPIVAGMLPILLMALLVLLFNLRLALDFLALVGAPLLIVLLLYVDYIQSMIIAALLSVVVPAMIYTRSGLGAAWIAPLVFFAGQVLFYTAFIAFFVRLDGFMLQTLPDDFTLVVLLIEALIALTLVFSLREGVVYLLWRLAMRQFDDDLHSLRLD
jgi:hypothetical protein